MEKTDLQPGEEVTVKVFLQPWRGERIAREVKIKLPASLSKGEHRLIITDADSLNRLPQVVSLMNRFLELPEAVNVINQERSNNRLYLSISSPKTSMLLDDKNLTSLPGSVMNVMQAARATTKPSVTMMESLEEVASLPFDYAVGGQYFLRFTVR
jgi:ATP-dependent 26S proteasome regulatory subunit